MPRISFFYSIFSKLDSPVYPCLKSLIKACIFPIENFLILFIDEKLEKAPASP
jgi:hypothetical protein